MSNLRNLRNRPFLVVNTIQRPEKGVNTSVKGWTEAPRNWAIFESPYVVDRVSNKVMREATVIIDIMGGSVVKNRFDEVADDEVLEHYLTKYKEYATRGVDVWLSKEAQKFVANGGLVQPEAAEAPAEATAEEAPAAE